MDPGPIEPDLLTLQRQHRSEDIWAAGGHGPVDSFVLRFRRCEAVLRRQAAVSPAVLVLIRQAGLQGLHDVPFRSLDCGLVTALVERWRPETHTFHLRWGEATVTLQDVELILGLPVHGRPVTGRVDYDWGNMCEELLGVRPPPAAIRGGRVKIAWLRANFDGVVVEDAQPEIVAQQARGYLLQLLGGTIFADHSATFVHLCYLPLLRDFAEAGTYSWGSATLSVLYNQLCHGATIGSKDVGGSFILLQIWAWDRLPHLSPRRRGRVPLPVDRPLLCRWRDDFQARDFAMHVVSAHRYTLDIGLDTEFVWQPYSTELISRLPGFCRAGADVWTACVPLVRFATVEMHQPDRVLRQFGYRQGVPGPSRSLLSPHGQDMRASTKDWIRARGREIAEWDQRLQRVVPMGVPDDGVYPFDDPYRAWYERRTRRYISRLGACTGSMEQCFQRLVGPEPAPDWVRAVGGQGIRLISIFRSLQREPPSPPPVGRLDDDLAGEGPPIVAEDPAPVDEGVPAGTLPDPGPSTAADCGPSTSSTVPLYDERMSPADSDLDWGILGGLGSIDAVEVDPLEACHTPFGEQPPKRRRTSTVDGATDVSGSDDDAIGPDGLAGVVTQVDPEVGGCSTSPDPHHRPQRERRAPLCGTGGHRVRPGSRGEE